MANFRTRVDDLTAFSTTDDGDKLTCRSAKEGDWIEITGDSNDWIITGMGGEWYDSGA